MTFYSALLYQFFTPIYKSAGCKFKFFWWDVYWIEFAFASHKFAELRIRIANLDPWLNWENSNCPCIRLFTVWLYNKIFKYLYVVRKSLVVVFMILLFSRDCFQSSIIFPAKGMFTMEFFDGLPFDFCDRPFAISEPSCSVMSCIDFNGYSNNQTFTMLFVMTLSCGLLLSKVDGSRLSRLICNWVSARKWATLIA